MAVSTFLTQQLEVLGTRNRSLLLDYLAAVFQPCFKRVGIGTIVAIALNALLDCAFTVSDILSVFNKSLVDYRNVFVLIRRQINRELSFLIVLSTF